jgi:hypothetical protein
LLLVGVLAVMEMVAAVAVRVDCLRGMRALHLVLLTL